MDMTLRVTAFTGLGPGVHQVAVTDVQIKQAKAGGDYLRWEFTDREGKTASVNSSVEMTPGNKTGKWFQALTGIPTTIDTDRKLSEVIGHWCTIVVELNPEGYPKVIAVTEAQEAAPKSPVKPLTDAKKAEQQHAIQEGEVDPTSELPF